MLLVNTSRTVSPSHIPDMKNILQYILNLNTQHENHTVFLIQKKETGNPFPHPRHLQRYWDSSKESIVAERQNTLLLTILFFQPLFQTYQLT